MSLRSRFMLSLIPALAIGAAACSKKAPPPEPTKAPPVTTKAPEDAAAPAPDTAPAPAPDTAPAPAPDTAPAPAPDAAPASDAAAPAPDAAAPAPDAAPPGPAAVWSADGFSAPESVLVTPEGDVYLVSNINGTPLDKDDNGFISKLGPDGKVIELKWIDGAKPDVELDAPKGMGIQNGVLFVSDREVVRKFDAKTGAPLGTIAIGGSTFLNDIAAPKDGKTVYVTDSAIGPDFKPKGTAAIFAITGDAAPAALEIPNIGLPNGVTAEVTADGDVLYFVGFDAAKAVQRFDAKAKTVTSVAVPGGSLDGLEIVKEGDASWFVVSSWETGTVYKIDKDGKATVLASGLKGPADLGVDAAKKVVLVPVMMENRVAAFAL